MKYDVLIVGGGPAGLSAALALGRARKRVLVCDAGPRRNATAKHMQNFVTRDGTPPDELRRIAHEQLKTYPSVEVRAASVASISGTHGDFRVELSSGAVAARRILLTTGMIDEMLPIDGFRELWGTSIFQCPYCHGWELQDRRWGYIARDVDMLHFAIKLRAWTRDVVVFTNGKLDSAGVPEQLRAQLTSARVHVETQPIVRLVAREGQLASVALANGTSVACDALFAHPPQRQVELVRALGVALDEAGSVRVDGATRETSVRGIYASGDLASRTQGAIFAAAAGTQAAAAINAELTTELAIAGLV